MSQLQHKQIFYRAIVKNPCSKEDKAIDWLTRLVKSVDMKMLTGPFANYSTEKGNEGIAAVCCLTTSHASLQVWDKEDPPCLHFDLYSCKKFEIQTVIDMLSEFQPYFYEWMLIDRTHTIKEEARGHKQVVPIISLLNEEDRQIYLEAEKRRGIERTEEHKKARNKYAKLLRKYSFREQQRHNEYFKEHRLSLGTLKGRAKRKKLEYNLDIEWMKNAFSEAKQKYPKLREREKGVNFWTADVDRINPSKGYIKENCRIIPHGLNVAKWNWSQEDLKNLLEILPGIIDAEQNP
jgi:hypothetical protein